MGVTLFLFYLISEFSNLELLMSSNFSFHLRMAAGSTIPIVFRCLIYSTLLLSSFWSSRAFINFALAASSFSRVLVSPSWYYGKFKNCPKLHKSCDLLFSIYRWVLAGLAAKFLDLEPPFWLFWLLFIINP